MIHVHYDINLVIGSLIVALVVCFLAISIEQLLFDKAPPKYEKRPYLFHMISNDIWSIKKPATAGFLYFADSNPKCNTFVVS